METIEIRKERIMSKNRYTHSALKEATNIVEKCIRRKTKKSKRKKMLFLVSIVVSILVTFLFILPYIF